MTRLTWALILVACGGSPDLPRAAPLQIAARLPEARHAVTVEGATFVWPSAEPPPGGPSEEACAWWRGEFEGRAFARRGLMDGTLRWGVIGVTRAEVSFAGIRVASLDPAGRPLPGDVDKVALQPLSEALAAARRIQDSWFEACGAVYRDRPLVVADADVPLDTLGYALDTAAVHRFPRVALLTGDRSPTAAPPPADDPSFLVVVRQDGTTLRAYDSSGTRRKTAPIKEAEGLLATVLGGERFGCTLVIPGSRSRVGEVTATLDTVTAFGSRLNLIHAVERLEDPGPLPAREGRTPTEWISFDDTLGALWIELPSTKTGTASMVACADIQGGGGKDVPLSPGLLLALESVAPDRVIRPNPMFGGLTPPTLAPGASPVDVVARGKVDVGEPGARPPAIQAAIQAAEACVPPTRGRNIPPSFAAIHVEFGPDGAPFDLQVETPFPDDAVSPCLRDAFASLPPMPPLGEDEYASVTFTIPFGGAP